MRSCVRFSGVTGGSAGWPGESGRLDSPLARELGLEGHVFSSVAQVEAGYVTGIASLLDKSTVPRRPAPGRSPPWATG